MITGNWINHGRFQILYFRIRRRQTVYLVEAREIIYLFNRNLFTAFLYSRDGVKITVSLHVFTLFIITARDV